MASTDPNKILRAKVNLSTGRFMIETQEPLFDPLKIEYEEGGITLRVDGDITTIRAECKSHSHLEKLVTVVFHVFPSVLNLYFPDAPYPLYAWGSVGSAKFRLEYEPTEVIGSVTTTTKKLQEEHVIGAWKWTPAVFTEPRLVIGFQYFHTACRLLSVGHNRFEFLAEALLNFSKCLQALCGEKRDLVRSKLIELGYNKRDIEGRFLPAMVLRDKFDVAHVSLSVLSRDQLQVLHRYADTAEQGFRDMLKRLMQAYDEGRYSLPKSGIGKLSPDKQKTLRILADNIRNVVDK